MIVTAVLLALAVAFVFAAAVYVRRSDRELETDEFIAALHAESPHEFAEQRPGAFVVDGVPLSPALRESPEAAQRFADAINSFARESRAGGQSARLRAAELSQIAATERYNHVLADENASLGKLAADEASAAGGGLGGGDR